MLLMDCRLCSGKDIKGEIATCHLGDMRRLSIRIGLACFSLLFVATSDGEGGGKTIDLAVTTALEYDDNVFLVSDPGQQRASDVVLRVAPVLGAQLLHREHSFSLGLNADYRKGTDTDIEDLNLTGTARQVHQGHRPDPDGTTGQGREDQQEDDQQASAMEQQSIHFRSNEGRKRRVMR